MDGKYGVQLFDEVDAKLSSDFDVTLSQEVDKLSYVLALCSGLSVSVVLTEGSHQPHKVKGTLSSLLEMQKRFSHEICDVKHVGTQTNDSIGVSNCVESLPEAHSQAKQHDVSVECKLLEPDVFTKSGRLVRKRADELMVDCLEDYDNDHAVKVLIPSVKQNATQDNGSSTKRKRGRPRKHQIREEVELKKSMSVIITQVEDVDKDEESSTAKTVVIDMDVMKTSPSKLPCNTQNMDKTRQQKLEYEKRTPLRFSCDLCSFQTKRQSHLARHKQYHASGECTLHKCRQCDFKTIKLSVLTRHQAVHEEQARLYCEKCSYSCLSAATLKLHKKIKHEKNMDTTKQCERCGYSTNSQLRYKRHLLTHRLNQQVVQVFQCDKCSYKTDKKPHFMQHIHGTHSDVRAFVCDICGMKFKRKHGMLQHHAFTHGNKQLLMPFKCDQCHKAFRSQAHLKEHLLRHSNDKKFLCHTCGAKFKTKSSQKRHQQSLHVNKRSYNCRKCNSSFHVRATLVRHQKTECKRKPRKDAFGLVHGDISLRTHDTSNDSQVIVENVPALNSTNQETMYPFHVLDEHMYIEGADVTEDPTHPFVDHSSPDSILPDVVKVEPGMITTTSILQTVRGSAESHGEQPHIVRLEDGQHVHLIHGTVSEDGQVSMILDQHNLIEPDQVDVAAFGEIPVQGFEMLHDDQS